MSNLTPPIISVVVLPRCQSITKICCVWQNPVTLFHTLGSISPISIPSHICRDLYRVIRFGYQEIHPAGSAVPRDYNHCHITCNNNTVESYSQIETNLGNENRLSLSPACYIPILGLQPADVWHNTIYPGQPFLL